MQLVYSHKARPIAVDQDVATVGDISRDGLRQVVETLSVPRHFIQQRKSNERIGAWLEEQLASYGYRTQYQGEHRNLMTVPDPAAQSVVLVGAHYDSVPGTPGADDNASALAALLACARAVAVAAPRAPVCFVAFNREEEHLLGSKDFVANYLPSSGIKVREAHILEMVGFCDDRPGSQRVPRGLPIMVKDVGDFLAVLGNNRSKRLVDELLCCASAYVREFPVIGLKICLGLENRVRHFVRSDHAPFWAARIPALMWTDTSEFRNPHYHKPSDTPETLDYDFLASVARLLIAHVMTAVRRD